MGSINCIRIAVFGHGRVGKTSLIKQYLFDYFEETYKETIEDMYRKDVTWKNQIIDLTILDAAGNYQFPAMRRLAIQQSGGFILAFSLDSIVSFREVQRLYEIVVTEKGTRDVPVLLVGNKVDINNRRVTRKEASEIATKWGNKVQYIEASAKEKYNVDLTFESLIKVIDEKNNEILRHKEFGDMPRSSTFSAVRASFRNSARKFTQSSLTPKRPSSIASISPLIPRRTVSTACAPTGIEVPIGSPRRARSLCFAPAYLKHLQQECASEKRKTRRVKIIDDND